MKVKKLEEFGDGLKRTVESMVDESGLGMCRCKENKGEGVLYTQADNSGRKQGHQAKTDLELRLLGLGSHWTRTAITMRDKGRKR